jgi:hypothetical protein
MTAADREKFFRDLQTAHPAWTPKFCSGYVHGADDEVAREVPHAEYIRRIADLDHYALGYLTGFAVHRGADCEMEKWFGAVAGLVEHAQADA